MLTNQKMLIGTVLEAMQKIDNNGDFGGLYEDLINRNITTTEVYNYITEVLQNWLEDSGNDEQIQNLIKFINEIYNN